MLKIIVVLLILMLSFSDLSAKKENNFELGQKELKARNYKKAIDNFTKAIKSSENIILSYYNRGLAYLFLNEFDKAVQDFNDVIKKDSSIADAYNNRGLSHSYMGNTTNALNDLNKAIELDKKFSQAYINRAHVFILRSDYRNAQYDLDSAAILEPKNPEIHYQLGRLNYNLDKYKESVDNFTKAIEYGLANAKTFYNRANSYYKNNQLNEALQDYTYAIVANPEDLEALNNRAFVYKALGMDSLASVDRAKIQEIKGGIFTPIDSLKFKTFTNKTGDFSIDLPDNWKLIEMPNEGSMINFIITPEDIEPESSSMMVGVTVGIMKNMSTIYPVKSESDILDFWKGSLDESNKDYLAYDVIWQRHNQWYGHGSILNQSYLKVGENFMPFSIYEYALAYGNNLIFMYMQSPEFSFDYHKQIYDKALASLKLGPNYKLE